MKTSSLFWMLSATISLANERLVTKITIVSSANWVERTRCMDLRWTASRSQLVSASRSAPPSRNSVQNVSLCLHGMPVRFRPHRHSPLGFLFIWAFGYMSTRIIPSWSDITGIVSIALTREDLLVQKRSSIASCRVFSRCNWCSLASPRMLISLLHKDFLLQSAVGNY